MGGKRYIALLILIGAVVFWVSAASLQAASTAGYAWGNKMGWINFGSTNGTSTVNIQVTTTSVTGYAWSQNFGWISFNVSPGYQYERAITVTSTASVASGTLTSFPMLVSSTLSSWEPVSDGGRIQNLCTAPNGGQEPCDLVFTSDPGCSSLLNFETESYSSSTGALVDWVNVPTMQAGAVIYACYDASGVMTDQSHPSATWNSNYNAVYHLVSNGATTTDSTANQLDLGLNSPTATSTLIDGGLYFNTTTLDVATATTNPLFMPSQMTVSFWIKPTSIPQNTITLVGIGINDDWRITGVSNDNVNITGRSTINLTSGANSLPLNTWTYVSFSLGSSISSVYINGVLNATTTGYSASAFLVTWPFAMGNYYSTSPGTQPYNGYFDELRIANVALSSQQILTEYNNQNSPSTFYSVGSETAESNGVINDGSGNLSGYAWAQDAGWINFSGVTIDNNGIFHGIASGTVAGSIQFSSSTGCTFCEVTTGWTPPHTTPLTVSGININTLAGGINPATITLTPNTTTNVNVNATITDNSCSLITGGTTTILLYRSGVGSSSCFSTANNLNCYQSTVFTASSTCSSGLENTTTTFPVQYFAQATDGSSSFPGQNWIATVIFNDSSHATSSADSTHTTSTNGMATLTALNVTTSSITYGNFAAGSTSGSVNQTTTIANAGNSSTTLQLYGTALSEGASIIATSSQHYATSTFTYGGSEQSLSGTATAVSGFLLTSPTSTTNVQSTIYWGLKIPNGSATGTYSGSNTFVATFSN